MKLYTGIEDDDDRKKTYYFEEGEEITRRQLERLVEGLRKSEEMREEILKMGVKGTRMVRLADGVFYDVHRKSKVSFVLQKH